MDSVGIFGNLLSEYEEEEQNKQSLIHIRRRIRSNFDPFDLPDVKFRPYFRVNKEAFAFLLNEIQRHHPVIKNACSVPFILKLAATLRFCAEEGYQTDVGNDFKKFKPTKLIQK